VRENKNNVVMSVAYALVKKRIIRVFEIAFLMVGHTHSDVDQFFAMIAKYIWRHKVHSMEKLFEFIQKARKAQIEVLFVSGIQDCNEFLPRDNSRLHNLTNCHIFEFTDVDGQVQFRCKEWAETEKILTRYQRNTC